MAQAAGFSFNSDTVTGSKVRDLAGYFLDGTIVGSAAIATGKTGYGDALNCTGGALQVQIPANTYPVNTDGGLTVAAWVKLNTTTSAARCIASGVSNGGATRDWGLYASNASGNVEFKLEGVTHSSTTSIRDGLDHHVMAVVDRVFGPGAETVRIVVDGTQVYSATGLTTGFAYTGDVSVWWGRNGVDGSEALDGLIDDARWWNDPVSSTAWAGVMGAEMVDLQWAIYPFDGVVTDLGIYNRDLTKTANGSFVDGFYGKALQSNSTGAGATGTVNFGDMDRLALTGYLRLDTAPSGSAKPVMGIQDTGGAYKFRAVVNLDRTITLTWITIYGTFSVTSTTALTVGVWTRYHFNMNPTYVGIRLGTNTQDLTSTGNSDPHLTPTVLDLKTLWVGGDASGGGQISFDYVNCTKNFIDVPKDNYWTGPANYTAVKPTNSARGVYEFNAGTGSTAVDQSAFGNNLTLTANGGWTTGIEGTALSNSGSVGPGARSTSITWSPTPTGWSFSGWFKCRAASSGARIVSMRNGASEVAHVFYLSGALNVRLYGSGGNTGLVSPNGSGFPAETLTHLAASCNGNTIQFYKNGVHYGSADYLSGTLLSPTTLEVGGDTTDGSGQEVADVVDSLVLFDTPLSASNVEWLFTNPGMFAAGVPVGQSVATSWRTAAAITQARATSWNTKAQVSQSRSTTWNVLAALVAVSKALSTSWNVASSTVKVTASRATSWAVKAFVGTGLSTAWNVESDIPPVVVPTVQVKFPTYEIPLGKNRLLRRYTIPTPSSLVKVHGEWVVVTMPAQDLLEAAEHYFIGGYTYPLTEAEVAALGLPPEYVEPLL